MVIVAGGSSTRFGADKLRIDIGGRSLLEHTIGAVEEHVDICVVACRPDLVETVSSLGDSLVVTAGGATRTLSELAGLAALGGESRLIGIHDAARPNVSPRLIELLFATAEARGGAVPLIEDERLVLDRRTHRPLTGVMRAQTPQVFRGPELMAAYVRAAQEGFEGHDTAETVERFSDLPIVAVEGDPENVKVTYPSDVDVVRELLTGPSGI